MALEGSLGTVVREISPIRITLTVLVGLCDVFVVLDVDTCPERGRLLVSPGGRILRHGHEASGQDQQLVGCVPKSTGNQLISTGNL